MAALPNDPATALANEASGDGLSVTTTVQPLHIRTEFRRHRVVVPTRPVVHLSADVAPGTNKVLRRGVPAITIVTERVVRWDSIVVDRQVVGKELAQRGRPALIAAGPPRNVTEALALTKFRKLAGVFAMIATAYTADSAQGGGRTATGLPARYGVVAVDPRIIPLGAHVFIPGYGTAIAADTGGSIVGNRIDLCMDSLQAALTFGRQPVRVYVLGL